MKTLCFVLSLYVFCLSTAPCCSGNDCSDTEKTAHTDHDSHDHNKRTEAICSPFLNCGTCTGFTFTKFVFNIEEVLFMIKKPVVVYKSQLIDSYVANIWQPPKIG